MISDFIPLCDILALNSETQSILDSEISLAACSPPGIFLLPLTEVGDSFDVDRLTMIKNATSASELSRRKFLTAATVAIATNVSGEAQQPVPIIDCHIHLFDQTRPQGAPYAGGRGNTEPALPSRYQKLAVPLGIVGAIEIDASPWVEDNLWVLEQEEKATFMVGTAGNLQPEKPEFKEYLDRYHKNKLFLGIRYGNVWGYNLVSQVENPVFIEGLKLMAQAGLTLDTGNSRPDLIAAIVRVKDKVPGLRIVFDHTANLAPRPPAPNDRRQISPADRTAMEANLRELVNRPHVYFKLSEVMQMGADGAPVTDPAIYKARLDYLFDIFGEDRVVFGSDWPNGNAVEHLDVIVRIARDYFSTKTRPVQEKFFWKNSIPAFQWIKREPGQPQLSGA
jgi:L-fuconolactonase